MNIPESLLLISILFQFTKYHQDCYIHLFDSITIEPILYYCHDFYLMIYKTLIHRLIELGFMISI